MVPAPALCMSMQGIQPLEPRCHVANHRHTYLGFWQSRRYGYTENVSQGTDFVQAVIHHVLNLLYQNLERVVDQFPELKDESAQIDACGMASGQLNFRH